MSKLVEVVLGIKVMLTYCGLGCRGLVTYGRDGHCLSGKCSIFGANLFRNRDGAFPRCAKCAKACHE